MKIGKLRYILKATYQMQMHLIGTHDDLAGDMRHQAVHSFAHSIPSAKQLLADIEDLVSF